MTHTEAADLIRLASYSCLDDDSKSAAQNAILAAVVTVMDAARAEALEPSIAFIAAHTGGLKDGTITVRGSPSMDAWRAFDAAIRAQSHREPKP